VADRQRFDIIYIPVSLGPAPTCHVLARGVEAIDRTHALLWWLRNELGVQVDPVSMFDKPIDETLDCGCELYLSFRMEQVGRMTALLIGTRAAAVADIECRPCDQHTRTDWQAPQRASRDWNGTVAAWKHKPGRPESFEAD